MIGRIVVTLAAVIAFTASCSSSGGSGGPSASVGGSSATAADDALSLRNGMLVGADGRTLYVNSADTPAHVICTESCTGQWPPVNGKPTAGTGVAATKLSSFTRPDGTVQATYGGHPLYEFSGDSAPGDTKGNGITDAGGTWSIAGSVTPSPGAATSAGSGGYSYP